MIKRILKTKVGFAIGIVAAVASIGGVATASANGGDSLFHHHRPPRIGYAIDQCKDDGWKTFKNPDGSQKFKNQGQCLVFFLRAGQGGHGPGQPGTTMGDNNTMIDVDASVNQDLSSGDVSGDNSVSGDVSASASTGVTVSTNGQ